MDQIRRYVNWGFIGSITVFVWSLAWTFSPKVVLVAAFCTITFYTLHHLLNFQDSHTGGDNVTHQRGDDE